MRKDFLAVKIRAPHQYAYNTHITIIAPLKTHLIRVKKAFDLVKSVDFVEYEKLFPRLDAVLVTRLKKARNNTFYVLGKIWIINQPLLRQDIEILASQLIHEGVHATQYINKVPRMPKVEREEEACEHQLKFLDKLPLSMGARRFEERKKAKIGIKRKYWKKLWKDKCSRKHFSELCLLFVRSELQLTYIDL